MVPKAQLDNDPVMASVVSDNARRFSWRGDNKRILVYPVDYDRQYNVTCTHPEALCDNEASNPDDGAAVGILQAFPP